MIKNRKFFIETVILQLLWIAITTSLTILLYFLLESVVINSIDKESPISGFNAFYLGKGRYVFLLVGFLVIIVGSFFIQKKQFNKYSSYYQSGIKYLKGETIELIPFHESLSSERDSFINLYNHQKQIEKEHDIAFKEKTDLLTYLAHDIKTPLSNMLGYISLLNDEPNLSLEQRVKFIKIIDKNAKYMKKLTDDFFSYLKFNLNKVPVYLAKLNIEMFFNQWKDERSPMIEDRHLTMKFINTTDKEIRTDPDLLLRVLDNLISNAQNYSVKSTPIDVILTVSDNFLETNISNIVNPELILDWDNITSKFYRGDMARSRFENSGSGLGLTIVNEIIKHLNGEFNISKKDNRISAVFRLPLEIDKGK